MTNKQEKLMYFAIITPNTNILVVEYYFVVELQQYYKIAVLIVAVLT